jgi:hypothetical protein
MQILGREEAEAETALEAATSKQRELIQKLDQYKEDDFDVAPSSREEI